jgi:hypothetical protein
MVAYGHLFDVLDLSTGYPLIASRTFVVERIIAPEHFQPTMLPLLACVINSSSAFIIFLNAASGLLPRFFNIRCDQVREMMHSVVLRPA